MYIKCGMIPLTILYYNFSKMSIIHRGGTMKKNWKIAVVGIILFVIMIVFAQLAM
jgi:uncharacterized integral membrane protein